MVTMLTGHNRLSVDEVPVGTPLYLGSKNRPEEDTVPAQVIEVLASHTLYLNLYRPMKDEHKPWHFRSALWEYKQIRARNLPIPEWMVERARGEHEAKLAGAQPSEKYPSPHFERSRHMCADHIAWINQAYATRFPDRDWLTLEGRAKIAAHVEEMIADGRAANEPDITGLPDLEHWDPRTPVPQAS